MSTVIPCAVYGCPFPHKARHLCRYHYHEWMQGRFVDDHDPDAGRLCFRGEAEPLVCVCRAPDPDAIGMCRRCGRLVVTFAHACRDRYRVQYPVEWARAEALGFGRYEHRPRRTWVQLRLPFADERVA